MMADRRHLQLNVFSELGGGGDDLVFIAFISLWL
jgi:hypothetical protein